MKKMFVFMGLLLFLCCFQLSVKAKEYEFNTLIPVGETATIYGERFNYVDFSFSPVPTEQGNGVLHFASIHNNMITQTPVSISVLLFDKDKINIGFLAYCSDKDFDSSYSTFKLKGEESTDFSISFSSKYYEKGKSSGDVSYIVVMDENKYCQIGEVSKYAGKSVNEILGLETEESIIDTITEYAIAIVHSLAFKIVLIVIGVLIILIGYGLFLDCLYQRMYTHKNYLAFLPLTNIYITVQLVFGHIIAIVFAVFFVAAVIFYYFHIPFLLFGVAGIWGISVILIIVKIITKKYDLFYFEPAMNSSQYGMYFDQEQKPVEEKKKGKKNKKKKEKTEEDYLLDNDFVNGNVPLDLNYQNTNKDSSSDSSIDNLVKSLEDDE